MERTDAESSADECECTALLCSSTSARRCSWSSSGIMEDADKSMECSDSSIALGALSRRDADCAEAEDADAAAADDDDDDDGGAQDFATADELAR